MTHGCIPPQVQAELVAAEEELVAAEEELVAAEEEDRKSVV